MLEKAAPLVDPALTVTVAVPEDLSVSACVALAPTNVLAKLMLVVLRLSCATVDVPVPERATDEVGDVAELLVNENFPETVPALTGANFI